MKKGYLYLLLGAIPAVGLAALAALNPTNVADTSETGEVLKTRHYKTDLQNFVAETEKIIPTLSTYGRSWKLVGGGGGGGRTFGKNESQYHYSATIIVEIPVVVFTDDLEINANEESGKDEITVNVRSASRIGNSDFGENRRHILQILKALDEKFEQHF